MNRTRWAVVGSGGFIGSALLGRLLRDRSNEVYAVSRGPVSSPVAGHATPARLIDGTHGFPNVDYAVFLSSGAVPSSSSEMPAGALMGEITLIADLLAAAVALRPRTLVATSSGGALYGHRVTPPIKESSPLRPSSPYGLAKVFLEASSLQAAAVHGLNAVCLRLTNPYGPGQDSARTGVGVIDAWARRALRGEPLLVYGDPATVRRDFLYIDDVVEAIVASASLRTSGSFNVGGGESTSLQDVIALLSELLGREIRVDLNAARPFDPPSNVLDSSVFRGLTGWAPQLSLNEGAARTIEYLRRTCTDTASH